MKLFAALFAATLILTPAQAGYIPPEEDVTALAQMAYGEARGLARHEIAACMWVALNRLDHGGYGDTVEAVVSAPEQFAGYSAQNPVDEHIAEIARDVLTRHWRESQGEEDLGRILPKDYYFFSGRNGKNWFRKEYSSNSYWDWSLPNIYALEEGGRISETN